MNTENHYAKAEMLIRKPIEEVFEAFIDPALTTKFWFTDSTGKLEEGKKVTWSWSMYHVSVPVNVKQIDPNKTILIEWGEGMHLSTVKWEFKKVSSTTTFLTITNYNFKGIGEDLLSQIRDSTGGFNLMVAALKAWLEHGIQLNLVADKAI